MKVKTTHLISAFTGLFFCLSATCRGIVVADPSPDDRQSLTLVGPTGSAAIIVDPKDYPVVSLAAGLFAGDVARVTGKRPEVTDKASSPFALIVGTLGHSKLVDTLAREGRLRDLDRIKSKWEGTLVQIVEKPFPGVERGLIIAGSDRRGTAYGLMKLSEEIGVSPWWWWADVPVKHRSVLALLCKSPEADLPGVKYRGIFLNDEDWGLIPWASKTFDPAFGNIGPKTYEKIFELLLRLRLNSLWPAMHACSREFGSVPENAELADKYAIVVGSSHCEPMLFNNVHWDEKAAGPWNYAVNRDAILARWEAVAKERSSMEGFWTLGIRGIHDSPMQGPTEVTARMDILSKVISDQRALIDHHVTKEWGNVAQCFIPYKEVLPIYDAGLQVPSDVTILWTDDNFGYIRRLSSPEERKRPGGSGIYWHLSYYGNPHSYTWINTTPPALIWEELHKAWENDARTLWIINVGDLKPMEIGVDFFSRFSWNPDSFGPDCQRAFLHGFAARTFGEQSAGAIARLLGDFYRLGSLRKPELMNRAWALSLGDKEAVILEQDYHALRSKVDEEGATIPKEARDAYEELVAFPLEVLADTGLIFMADRKTQLGHEIAANEAEIDRLKNELETLVVSYNTHIAGGKWNLMMPGLVTGKDLTKWSSQVRWPWGEKPDETPNSKTTATITPERVWRDAATADRRTTLDLAHWSDVTGLGPSGRAVALLPATIDTSWSSGDRHAPVLEYNFKNTGEEGTAYLDFLPTMRLVPGMQLRVGISVDDARPVTYEVPGSSGKEDEKGSVRKDAVQSNRVRVEVPLPGLSPGHHVLRITAMDPGVVIDRISLP